MKLVFRATIELRGINPFVHVEGSIASQVAPGWRKSIPVRASLNGKPEGGWLINLMPAGDGRFYLYLNGEVRKAAGVKVGDRVKVALQFAADYVPGPAALPASFQAALEAHSQAKLGWDALSPSRRKEIVRYLLALKSQDARKRNIHRALHVLAGGRGRFMARDWPPHVFGKRRLRTRKDLS